MILPTIPFHLQPYSIVNTVHTLYTSKRMPVAIREFGELFEIDWIDFSHVSCRSLLRLYNDHSFVRSFQLAMALVCYVAQVQLILTLMFYFFFDSFRWICLVLRLLCFWDQNLFDYLPKIMRSQILRLSVCLSSVHLRDVFWRSVADDRLIYLKLINAIDFKYLFGFWVIEFNELFAG